MNHEEKLIKKILVALDGSIYSDKVAKYGEELALRYKAEIALINVIETPKIIIPSGDIEATTGVTSKLTEKLIQEMESKAKILITEYKENMESKGLNARILIEKGNAADIIITIAEKQGYDLIIVGCRGLGNIKRFFLGSVSDKISKHAHCPVLIVR